MVALVLRDGDVISRKFSIGCDATNRTVAIPLVAGSQPGLDGHINFEADASMDRSDCYLNQDDNYSLNGTKPGMMVEATENPNFFFGPADLLLYGDAAFLPELFADGQKDYIPDVETISTFFGAHQNEDGYINRIEAYDLVDEVNAILSMYLPNPVLFGGNTAAGKFYTLDFGAIKDGMLQAGSTAKNLLCLIFQPLTAPSPGVLNGVDALATGALELVSSTVGDVFTTLGCPAPLNGA